MLAFYLVTCCFKLDDEGMVKATVVVYRSLMVEGFFLGKGGRGGKGDFFQGCFGDVKEKL